MPPAAPPRHARHADRCQGASDRRGGEIDVAAVAASARPHSMVIRLHGRATRSCARRMGSIVAWHWSLPGNSFPSRRVSTGFGSETATACTTSRPTRPNEVIPFGSAGLRPTAPWKRSASEFIRTGLIQNGSCCGCTASGASPGGRPVLRGSRNRDPQHEVRLEAEALCCGCVVVAVSGVASCPSMVVVETLSSCPPWST